MTDPALTERLERTWQPARGLFGWFAEVDHKAIGLRFVVTALLFFALGGVLALLMRTQLAQPANDFLGPDAYNQLFTVHGTTMMFLFAVPVLLGLGIYLVPLMIGARNVAFPRLAAYSYWTYLAGCLLLYAGLFTNTGPDQGWFSYVPLAGPRFSPGKGVDVWAQTITFSEIAMLGLAVTLIVTILKHRAPGMALPRMPMFVWAILVTAFMVTLAMTTVAMASLFLAADRLVGTHFFNPAEGGDALLWQHLFWFFAHPEVYIIFLPATGIVSQLVLTFSRRPLVGYPALVFATIATGIISYGVWVHHMFGTGLPHLGESYFSASSMLVAVPTAVQIFCWIATLWAARGRRRLGVPLLFVLGFLFIFVRGGITGVAVASIPFDLQAHDTFFVVGHLHDVLIGGFVFPLLGGLLYWFPKWSGRMPSEVAGRASFALLFIGQNLTFFPMHLLGLAGMPRRTYTYLPQTGWGDLNLAQTLGAYLIALGVLVFVGNLVHSLRRGRAAGSNPWEADGLEWATSSPPPPYNFAHLPVVEHRYPLWQATADRPVVVGLPDDRRAALVTTAVDAAPDSITELPGASIWPAAAGAATGVTFVLLIFSPWGLVIGVALLLPTLLLWGWPRKPEAA